MMGVVGEEDGHEARQHSCYINVTVNMRFNTLQSLSSPHHLPPPSLPMVAISGGLLGLHQVWKGVQIPWQTHPTLFFTQMASSHW